MLLIEPDYELDVARRRGDEIRAELAALALRDRSGRPSGLVASVDAALLWLSRGARAREAARAEQGAPGESRPSWSA